MIIWGERNNILVNVIEKPDTLSSESRWRLPSPHA